MAERGDAEAAGEIEVLASLVVPDARALAPDDVVGLRDVSGQLATRQDVTPMALAHQALILDASSSPAERAMRGAVRAMQL